MKAFVIDTYWNINMDVSKTPRCKQESEVKKEVENTDRFDERPRLAKLREQVFFGTSRQDAILLNLKIQPFIDNTPMT